MTVNTRFWKTDDNMTMATLYLYTKEGKPYQKYYNVWFLDEEAFKVAELNKTYKLHMYETGNCDAYLKTVMHYNEDHELVPTVDEDGYEVKQLVVKNLSK